MSNIRLLKIPQKIKTQNFQKKILEKNVEKCFLKNNFQIPMKNSCNTSTSSKMTFISDSVHGIVQFGSKICNPSSKLSSMPRPLKFSSSYVSLLIQFSSLPTITTRMTISKMPFQSEIQVRLLTI